MLTEYSHDRSKDLEPEVDQFKKVIDDFADSQKMDNEFAALARMFDLPNDKVKQDFKKQLAETYDWKRAQYPGKLKLKSLLKYIGKFYGYFLYVISGAQSSFKSPPEECDLLIEWIESDLEAKRFKKLAGYFKNPLLVTMNPLDTEVRSIHRPLYKGYSRKEVLRVFIHFWTRVFPRSLWNSVSLKTNLFAIYLPLVDRYLYYFSLFETVGSTYLLQERHYQTSAIKTALYKRMGGKFTSTLQKNIIHGGYSGFYYDVDCFFSLGEGTVRRALRQGGELRNVFPVGSMFMEYSWYTIGGRRPDKVYDVVYLGLNMIDFHNAYDAYLPDYYEHIRWMARFAEKFPQYKIGIKHHANNVADAQEKEIIDNSQLIHVTHEFNSYEHAMAAKCTLTWGSTMGYELLDHNVPCLFLDPGRREFCFLPYHEELDPYRVVTYEEFETRLLELLQAPEGRAQVPNPEFFCMNSENTAQKIWKTMTEGRVSL